MAEVIKSYLYDPKEIVEILIKKQGLHEGIWGLSIEFKLGVTIMGPSEIEVYPTAVASIARIGLQRYPTEINVSLDAAKINPPSKKTKPAKRSES